jgi:hypothetical protein
MMILCGDFGEVRGVCVAVTKTPGRLVDTKPDTCQNVLQLVSSFVGSDVFGAYPLPATAFRGFARYKDTPECKFQAVGCGLQIPPESCASRRLRRPAADSPEEILRNA